MRLTCVGRYRSDLGSYEPGDVFDVADEIGGELQRSSPSSFRCVAEVPASDEGKAAVGDSAAEPDLSAMSTETQTGFVVPDRRAKGGKIRSQGG